MPTTKKKATTTKKTTKATKTTKEKSSEVVEDNLSTILDIGKDIGFSPIGSTDTSDVHDYLPTFIPSLDAIIGGGFPFRRFSEVFGAAGAGKSTLLVYMTMIASKLGIPIFWVDTEGTTGSDRLSDFDVDMRYVQIFDLSSLGKTELLTVEKIDSIIEGLLDKYLEDDRLAGHPAVIIWDSIAGTISQEESETGINESERLGRPAAAITRIIRRITPKLNKCDVSVLVTNQVRANMDAANKYSPKTKRASGGKALDHAETVRLSLAKGQKLTGMTNISRGVLDNGGKNVIGHKVTFKGDKNKNSPEEQTTKLDVYTSELLSDEPYVNLTGLDFYECITTDAIGAGIIKNAAGFYTFITKNGEIYKKRRKDFLLDLRVNDEVMTDLFEQTLMFYFPYRYPAMNNENIDITKFKYWTDTLTEKYKDVKHGRL